MEEQTAFLPLLVVTVLAVLVPVIANRIRRFRFPIVVGEILAGILIGKSGLDLVHGTPTLTFLGDFGFAFLMFLSGLEVDLQALFAPSGNVSRSSRWKHPLALAFSSFSLTMLLAIIIGLGLSAGGLTQSAFMMGLILSTTSLGIVVPILKERNLTATRYGQLLLIAALISDFVTLLLLGLAFAFMSRGLSLDLFLFLLLLGIFLVAARIGQWAGKIPLLPRIIEELSHATAQIRVRGAFALLVISVALAEALGVEVILGAFMAGAILSLNIKEHDSPLRMKLDAIGYGFFIPIFFIKVGAGFDLGALLVSRSALLLVPILIVSAYLVKLIPALLFRVLFSWKEALAAGVLLSSRLSLIIAASEIAFSRGIITAATNSAIILVAIVTCTVSPLLFGRLLPAAAEKRRSGVVILGTDQLATLLAQRLLRSGEPVTIIGRDQPQLQELARVGFRSVIGNPEDVEVLERAGLHHARAMIALSRAPETVRKVCRLGREQYGIPIIIARADDRDFARQLQSENIRVVRPAMAVALAMEGALRFPAAFDMLMDKEDNVDLMDVPLSNPDLAGKLLRRVHLPGNALILGIQREGEVVVPHGDTVLRADDILALVGNPDSLQEACLWLNPGNTSESG